MTVIYIFMVVMYVMMFMESWLFRGSSMVSTIRMMFGILALAVCVGFLAGIYDLWTQQTWTRLVLIASAVASIIVIVPWTNVWPRGSVFCALLFDAVVLVAFLPAWGERFAEEGEPL